MTDAPAPPAPPDLPPEEGMSAAVAATLRYWRAIRPAPGLLPGRQHFDPLDLAPHLPNVWLLDVERDPLVFRYRLIGTAITEAGNPARPGDRIDDPKFALGERAAEMLDRLARVAEGGIDYARGRPFVRHRKELVALERISLPLARDGRTVDMVLNASVASWQPGYR